MLGQEEYITRSLFDFRFEKSLFGQMTAVAMSGVFDTKAYIEQNPDVGTGVLKSIWHYTKYSKIENRSSGQPFLQEWLLEHLAQKQVSMIAARRLVKKIKSAEHGDRANLIKLFCNKNNLSFEAYCALKSYSENDFKNVRDHIQRIDENSHPIESLLLHFKLAKKRGLQSGINEVFEAGLSCLNSPAKLTTQFYTALHEISWALGKENYEGRSVAKLILSHMERSNFKSQINLTDDLWTIGIPIIEPSSSLCNKHVPTGLRELMKPLRAAGIESFWKTCLNAAAANALNPASSFIRLNTTNVDNNDKKQWRWEAISLDDAPKKIAHVRMPPKVYWTAPAQSDSLALHLNAFLKVVKAAAESGYVLYFVPAGQIYDISSSNFEGDIVLTYHSYRYFENNGSKLKQLPVFVHIKESALPDFYQFDTCGFSGWSCPELTEPSAVEAVESFFETLTTKFVKNRISKYAQPQSKKIDIEPGFVFVPLQIQTDTVTQLANIDMFEAIICLAENPDFNRKIVLKRHPKDASLATEKRINKIVNSYSNVDLVDAAIDDILAMADVVLTVNSGVGVEALLRLMPVVTLGKSDYESVSYSAKTLDAVKSAIDEAFLAKNSLQHQAAIKKYLYQFYNDNCFRTDLETSSESLILKIKTTLEFDF